MTKTSKYFQIEQNKTLKAKSCMDRETTKSRFSNEALYFVSLREIIRLTFF